MSLVLIAKGVYTYFKKRSISNDINDVILDVEKKMDSIDEIVMSETIKINNYKENLKQEHRANLIDAGNELISVSEKVYNAKKMICSIDSSRKLKYDELDQNQKLICAIKENISTLESKLATNSEDSSLFLNATSIVEETNKSINLIEKSIKLNDPSLIKGNLASEVPAYLMGIYGKLESFVPDYFPIPGTFLKNPKKFEVKVSEKEAIGKSSKFFPKLEIICSYRDVEPTIEELKKINKSSNKYRVQCYVLPRINDELRNFASGYVSSNTGLFFYDLSTKEIIENKNNKKAHFFEGYFNPSSSPKTIMRYIAELVHDNTIPTGYVQQILNKKSIKKLENQQVIQLLPGGRKYHFHSPLDSGQLNIGGV